MVFGTLLFGRMQGGASAERVLGLFINTLPVRIRLDETGVAQSLRETQTLLAELVRHEHAPLALAQRCSGVPAPTPLFSALFNYRHSQPQADAPGVQDPTPEAQVLWWEERTNYPLALAVDDLGDAFTLTAQVRRPVRPELVCALMETSLQNLLDALEHGPDGPISNVEVLPGAERQRLLVDWNATAAEFPRDCACTSCSKRRWRLRRTRWPSCSATRA